MRKREIGLVIYGMFLIAYFSLSIMAFMASPLSWVFDFIDGFSLLVVLVAGFILYSVWVIRKDNKTLMIQ